MFRNLKEKKEKVNTLKGYDLLEKKVEVPDGMFEQCPKCNATLDGAKLQENFKVCMECDYHMRMHIAQRARLVFDEFHVFNHIMKSTDPLSFPGYQSKLESLTDSLGVYDAVVCAEAKLNGKSVIGIIMDPDFLMGSMGSVVGERITRSFERALKQRKPVILFAASGGARMQEGLISLMQMAKTSGAIGKYQNAGGLFISVLTDPTTGGVSASFANLGDIILAEPKALIGFAGPRVIAQTIQEDLPEGFQSSEFLLEKGFIDKIVHRHDMKETLSLLLNLHGVK
ncbi:MAG: acetyl-CoA carboxylase carboxyltransferase subunit beta [Erysipelothrix sp.]|nr:acetyl-CoA carboxylase carboxyltransferase subunit beta [Erysipelothrix sp.]